MGEWQSSHGKGREEHGVTEVIETAHPSAGSQMPMRFSIGKRSAGGGSGPRSTTRVGLFHCTCIGIYLRLGESVRHQPSKHEISDLHGRKRNEGLLKMFD